MYENKRVQTKKKTKKQIVHIHSNFNNFLLAEPACVVLLVKIQSMSNRRYLLLFTLSFRKIREECTGCG